MSRTPLGLLHCLSEGRKGGLNSWSRTTFSVGLVCGVDPGNQLLLHFLQLAVHLLLEHLFEVPGLIVAGFLHDSL